MFLSSLKLFFFFFFNLFNHIEASFTDKNYILLDEKVK